MERIDLTQVTERSERLRRRHEEVSQAAIDAVAQARELIEECSSAPWRTTPPRAELAKELDGVVNVDQRLAELQELIRARGQHVLALGKKLSKGRKAAAAKLDEAILGEVAEMELAEATFVTSITPLAEGTRVGDVAVAAHGLDQVEFLWSANRGEPARPLARSTSRRAVFDVDVW